MVASCDHSCGVGSTDSAARSPSSMAAPLRNHLRGRAARGSVSLAAKALAVAAVASLAGRAIINTGTVSRVRALASAALTVYGAHDLRPPFRHAGGGDLP